MAEPYELPEDLAVLSDDDIEHHLTAASREMQRIASADTTNRKKIDALRKYGETVDNLKAEKQARITAAAEAAAEIDAIMKETFGEPEDDETTADASEAETEATAETEDEAETTTTVVEPTAVVTASSRRSINLAAVRARQNGGGTSMSRYLADDTHGEIELTAAVDVPGFRPGQGIELGDVTQAVIRRAQSLTTAGGGMGMVASYTIPFPEDLQVDDVSSAPEGSLATVRAADQNRLDGNTLTASGGWCAPSETIYSFTERSCPDGLWDLPEIQINRGGLRFFRTPVLDVAAMTFTHTEANDIAGATKPCFTIPCATPIDVRAAAYGACIQYGILTARYFPELIDMYIRQSMIAHEISVKTNAYAQARAAATAVTIPATFAAFSAVYAAVALQIADMIERLNLCEGTALEVVFPMWVKNAFMADIARQQGVKVTDLDPMIIEGAFARLGARVQFARGLAPDVPANIGAAAPAVAWPADMEFLIYEAGSFQLGRGPQIDLGVVIDSTTMSTNDAKQFSEEGILLVDRAGTARRVTVPICPTGTVGAVPTTAFACPVA
jgi:hypothetical protein